MNSKSYIAGEYKQQLQYQSFAPSSLARPFDFTDPKILVLLEEAARALGELNAFSNLIPDVDFFIQMHIAKEALSSTRIEGTVTELDEIFIEEENITPERVNDRKEVMNYIQAMNESILELQDLPFCMRLIKNAHKTILAGVRGENKFPGEIRKSQNWIGGKTIQNARFIPPHPDDLADCLADLEKFWHNTQHPLPHLIKIAITHYQFETIHPFCDGNGRVGRLMITLYLVNFGLLNKPTLYLSEYFDEVRQDYYDAFDRVRDKNNIESWIRFFLDGVIFTARDSKEVLEAIVNLRSVYEDRLSSGLGPKRRVLGFGLVQKLFCKPTMTIDEVAKSLNITFQTASSLVTDLEKIGMLREKTGFSRNRIFELWEYMDLFRRKKS
jgi:Fic family protein